MSQVGNWQLTGRTSRLIFAATKDLVEEEGVSSAALVQRLPELAARIVSAYVAGNHLPAKDLPRLIAITADSVEGLFQPERMQMKKQASMALFEKTVSNDYIVCLENGRRYRSLKQTLRVRYGITPEEYRTKWGLPDDYPMVAPSLAAQRAEGARRSGPARRKMR